MRCDVGCDGTRNRHESCLWKSNPLHRHHRPTLPTCQRNVHKQHVSLHKTSICRQLVQNRHSVCANQAQTRHHNVKPSWARPQTDAATEFLVRRVESNPSEAGSRFLERPKAPNLQPTERRSHEGRVSPPASPERCFAYARGEMNACGAGRRVVGTRSAPLVVHELRPLSFAEFWTQPRSLRAARRDASAHSRPARLRRSSSARVSVAGAPTPPAPGTTAAPPKAPPRRASRQAFACPYARAGRGIPRWRSAAAR